MNNIGNDNYQPGLTPPKPMRENTGWLSSNMAQLMVFLNGVILTVTAFATLNVFISEIVREELLETTNKVQEEIFTNFSQAEKSINALSTILSQTESIDSQGVYDYVETEIKTSGYFDSLYYLANGSVFPLLVKNTSQISVLKEREFIEKNFIDFQNIKENQYIFLPLQEDSDGVNGAYGLVKKHINAYGLDAYTIAVFSFDAFYTVETDSENNTVEQVKILNAKGSEVLFIHQNKDSKGADNFAQYSDIKTQRIAGQDISIEVGLKIGTREAFLQKIPLLMLLFGVTLTLIGTLYVRNNQLQSKKLSKMNKELAHKNFELNQQVTERERLNDMIQKSALEHSTIINAVSDIIVELSDDGKIQFLNEAWKTVTGFDLDRSIGRSIFDMIYVQDQAELKKSIKALISGASNSYRSFTRIRSADGKFRAVEFSLSLVRQSDQKEMHLVGTITDVEERRRAERALSEAEKKYRNIVENAASGIYQVTPAGQFLSVNPAYARILKYDSSDLILRDVRNATEDIYKDSAERDKFLTEIELLNIAKSYETQVKRADGTVVWISDNVRPVFDEEQNLLYFEGSIEDIDQRRKAQMALKEAKTESDLANRAKSEFLANMSHELRTPLNAVIGFSDIIRSEAFGKIEQEEYKEYAGSIYDSGNNLLKVINEILDVSRIEAGERTLQEGAVNVRESVLSCISLMDNKIKSAKIRIENKVTDEGLGLIGESQAIKQMILNLVGNSVKFSPPNSLIMIDANVTDRGQLNLSITDTGIGMTDLELEKALSPFGQVEVEHNRNTSGTGLGLTLVKSLIELHGGELDLVSQKGIGTTATLIFPAKRVTQKNIKKENTTTSEEV